MDAIPKWRMERDAKIHAKWFGYPDEQPTGDIAPTGEYMSVNHRRLNLPVITGKNESVCTGSLSNN